MRYYAGLCIALALPLAPAARAGEPPVLRFLAGDLTDDIVVTASSSLNARVEIAVQSSPVSLVQITDGLISGSPADGDRTDAVKALENERRLTAEMVRSLNR